MALDQLSFGVAFIQPVDVYVRINRGIKCGVLFIVLSFVALFRTETLTRSRLHPLQHALVGLAQAVFYLLLVSPSEHVSITQAYAVAALARAGLTGIYLRSALYEKRLAIWLTLGVALLYSMLYVILRSGGCVKKRNETCGSGFSRD